MTRELFKKEQIFGALKESEAGPKNDDICRRNGIINASLYSCCKKYVGMESGLPTLVRRGHADIAAVLAAFLLSMPSLSRAEPPSKLATILADAAGGETIVLADGYYGNLSLGAWQSFPSNVTIQAETPLGASFGIINIQASNVTLDGISSSGRFTIRGADSVEVINSKMTSWTEALFATNVVFEGNDIKGTLSIEETSNFRIADNFIHEVEGDLLRIVGNSTNGLVENNSLWDTIPRKFPDGTYIHADHLQMFSTSRGTPQDIVIRGNHIYDDPTTGDGGNLWGQAIFLGGPSGGYRNIIIEENLIDTNSPHGISFYIGPEGNIIRNNTVLGSGAINVNGGDSSGTQIYGNVAKVINAADGAVVGDNYIYSAGQEASLFQGNGDGSTWQGFLPESGSAIDFGSEYGAIQRLAELRDGGPVANQ